MANIVILMCSSGNDSQISRIGFCRISSIADSRKTSNLHEVSSIGSYIFSEFNNSYPFSASSVGKGNFKASHAISLIG